MSLEATRPSRRGAERGVVLFLALIVVVMLSLAAVALIRSVDTGTMVIGNLGFKQDTVQASDQATERAIAWIAANLSGTTLQNNVPGQGYYASSMDTLDMTGRSTVANAPRVDWEPPCDSTSVACASAPIEVGPSSAPLRASYIITRLCPSAGAENTLNCAKPMPGASGESSKRSGLDYSEYMRFTGSATAYYRIVTRTVGARNTVSYTETIIHF